MIISSQNIEVYQDPNYLIGDWGQGSSSRGILCCFEEIREYWLAFKNSDHDFEYNIFYIE